MFRTITRYGTWLLAGHHNRVPGEFLFLHIAKTAGTSFTAVLERPFPPWRVNRAYEMPAITAEPPERFARYRLVRGHFVYSLVEQFAHAPHVIVMLRDPLARALSHLRHMQREPNFWLHAHLAIQEMTLEELLDDDRVVQIIRDYQTRIMGHEYDLSITSLQTMDEAPAADTAMLRRAMERLEACEFVGLTERFEESVGLLCATFKWRLRTVIPYLNVTPNGWDPHQVTAAVRARLAELTAYDDKLYVYAQNLFEERLAALSAEQVSR